MSETNWYRWNEKRAAWEFNHRQHGWNDSQSEPNPISAEQQKSWHGAKWKKERVNPLTEREVRAQLETET